MSPVRHYPSILQGHPTDLFLTISVLHRNFCWLGTEVSAVLLASKVLNLRSRIYQNVSKILAGGILSLYSRAAKGSFVQPTS